MGVQLEAHEAGSGAREDARSGGIRVLVCGGRGYSERRVLGRYLATIHADTRISLLIQGGAAGADRLAKQWAQHARVPVAEFPANWQFEGRAAGMRRNACMLTFGQPDLVVAFPGGAGTAGMVRLAHDAGVQVLEVAPEARTSEPATPSPDTQDAK